jgi:hypothetical protein
MTEEKPCRNAREDDRLYLTLSPLEDAGAEEALRF